MLRVHSKDLAVIVHIVGFRIRMVQGQPTGFREFLADLSVASGHLDLGPEITGKQYPMAKN